MRRGLLRQRRIVFIKNIYRRDVPSRKPTMAAATVDQTTTGGFGADLGESLAKLDIPDLFNTFPPIQDDLDTETSVTQDETSRICLPYLSAQDPDVTVWNLYGVPPLARDKHAAFFHRSLERLPGRAVALDASRPWYLYWCLNGLKLLGEELSSYRESLIETARSMQNDSGGFGGGGRQFSHLATSYATVLALAVVGGSEALDVIDRKQMWKWLCQLKQLDGGFQVCLNGEEDIRLAYWRHAPFEEEKS
jgi:protein farnesyltransferase subunit beta